MPYYTYILKSLKDQGCYYGHCHDLENRLRTHNAGKVTSTKCRSPLQVHYFEEFPTKSEASKREYFFKTVDGYRFLKSIGII